MEYINGEWGVSESSDGKELIVEGPCDLQITIDHDDVNHTQVEAEAKQLIDLLAGNWKEVKVEDEQE